MSTNTSTPTATSGPVALSLPDGCLALNAQNGWGVLGVHGADATRFLHAQTTQDFALLKPNQAHLAALCSPKGRVQASFVAVRLEHGVEDSYALLCRQDVLEPLMRRLRMFVLRSKVVLEDAGQAWSAFGLLGTAAMDAWAQADAAELLPWTHATHTLEDGTVRHLVSLYPAVTASGSVPRIVCIQPAAAPSPSNAEIPVQAWEQAEVLSGVVTVGQATWEAFVPQMVNFESIDGVNFKKGCYPGQEVVARSQFRGAIKRRGWIASQPAGGLPAAGQEVWLVTAGSEPEPCGSVAQAVATADGALLLASLQSSAVESALQGQASLHAGSPDAPSLQLHALPYPLRDDI